MTFSAHRSKTLKRSWRRRENDVVSCCGSSSAPFPVITVIWCGLESWLVCNFMMFGLAPSNIWICVFGDNSILLYFLVVSAVTVAEVQLDNHCSYSVLEAKADEVLSRIVTDTLWLISSICEVFAFMFLLGKRRIFFPPLFHPHTCSISCNL